MKKLLLVLTSLFALSLNGFTQPLKPVMYPANWWTGMKWNKLQLMLHGKDINPAGKVTVTTSYPGITVTNTVKADNPNYLFINIQVNKNALPGRVYFSIRPAGKAASQVSMELKPRRSGRGTQFAQGVKPKDLVYLLMPDRFANGDYSNDKIPGMRYQALNRDSMYERHGGDLQGVIDHLDYLQDLGVTALWMMPVLENDVPSRSEHGYKFTNHYKIDPRLGGEAAYKKLSDALHQRGMKLIQDAVYNHVGNYHHTILDKPFRDWVHEWPAFTNTSYKDQVLFDPHAAPSQKKVMSDGWFEPTMPDLNQGNPFVANFLIQHAIWSVEEFGVDGWRIDTYAYNDLHFMNRCNKALTDEYPSITMFGETWVHGVPNQSFFCENNYTSGFKSNLQNTTDFQTLFYGIQPALNEKFGWTEGINKLYTTVAQDFLYKHPENQVIFLDNHDISRFYSIVNEDVDKYKMALGWLLSFRGIPQLYYGMEHLMTGHSNPDGKVRHDFKGGWKEDKENKFTATGRTAKEDDVFNYIRTLARFRKNAPALSTGKLMQYLPEDGLYVYFRYCDAQTIMCIMNTGEKTQTIDFAKYAERTNGFRSGRNVLSNTLLQSRFTIEPMRMLILELQR